MLICRSVWGFECLVSILSFKFFIRFSLHQKMNHNYFFVSSMFCCCQLCSSWGSRSWCCTKSRSCTRCCLYQTSDGAVPHMWHMMFSGPNHGAGPHQFVELHSGYHHFPYGLLKTKKSLKTYTKKSRETFKNQRTPKRSIPGSLGHDMSLARIAENSKGDRRCWDEICAKWNAYMCLYKHHKCL